MMISTKGRYALRVMLDMAEHGGGEWHRLSDVAQRQQLAVLRQRLVQFNPRHAPGRSRTQKKFAVPFRRPLTS